MAIAALGIELERRWHSDGGERDAEPTAEAATKSALTTGAAAEAAGPKVPDATEPTRKRSENEPIGKTRQRLSSGGGDHPGDAGGSNQPGAAQQLRDGEGHGSVNGQGISGETSTGGLGFIGRGGSRGKVSAAGAATTTADSATSGRNGVQISGTFLAGPVVSQNTIGIRAYSESGTLLASTRVNSDGTYTLILPDGYAGYVLVEAIDLDPLTPDYVDERTREAQNLTTALRSIGYVGGADMTLHVNPITEIATQRLGLAEGFTALQTLGLSQAQIDAAEVEIARALGIPTDFMRGAAPIATISTDGQLLSGVSDAYGITLAAISGAELGSSTSEVLRTIARGISSSGLDQTSNTLLVNGATLADSSLGEKMLLRQKSGQQTLSYSASNILPLVIAPLQKINDKSIGVEQNIFWPGSGTARIIVSNQPGVITDVAVAVAIRSLGENKSSGTLYLTLISPDGVRVPIAGTANDERYLAYDGNNKAPVIFQLNAGEVKSLLISEKVQSRDNFAINESIAESLSSESSQISLSTLKALNGTDGNGEWQLEVRNSRGDMVQLDGWQLFLKTAELNTVTDRDGEYDFSRLGSSTTSGALTPWITAPDNRAILSPAGRLNAKTGLSTATSQISFGLSTVDEERLPHQADETSWSRIDPTSLMDPTSLHPTTTLNQAVTALTADAARAKYGVDGTGLRVGIISTSYNLLKGEDYDIKRGLLTEKTAVVHEGFKADHGVDEGRAMAQLVHSIAPGAKLYFSAFTDVDNSARVKELLSEKIQTSSTKY